MLVLHSVSPPLCMARVWEFAHTSVTPCKPRIGRVGWFSVTPIDRGISFGIMWGPLEDLWSWDLRQHSVIGNYALECSLTLANKCFILKNYKIWFIEMQFFHSKLAFSWRPRRVETRQWQVFTGICWFSMLCITLCIHHMYWFHSPLFQSSYIKLSMSSWYGCH